MFTSCFSTDVPSVSVLDWLFGGPFNHLPNTPVLIDADNPSRWLSLATYRIWSKRFGLGLRNRGFHQGNSVLCYAENMLAFPVAMMGTISSGAYFISPHTHPEGQGLSETLEMCMPSLILVERDLLGIMTASVRTVWGERESASIWVMDDAIFDSEASIHHSHNEENNWKHLMAPLHDGLDFDWSLPNAIDLDQTVSLNFTSGSTAIPKPIVHTHRSTVGALCSLQDLCKRDLRYQNADPCVSHLLVYRVNGDRTRPRRHSLFIWPALGVQTYIMTLYHPARVFAHIERHNITDLSTDVSVLEDLQIEAKANMTKINHPLLRIISTDGGGSGERASKVVASLWPGSQVMLQDKYGMSELGGVMGDIPDQGSIPPTSVGKLLANCEARLLDVETGKETSLGMPGLLWLRTPGICRGYLISLPNTVEGVTEDGWYNTGDIGYVDEAENWFIMGRKEDILKINGHLMSPLKIETWILDRVGVIDVAVVAVTTKNIYHIQAYVVPETGQSDLAGLQMDLETKLKAGGCVVGLSIVPHIPKFMAKVRRKTLREWLHKELGEE